MIVGTRVPVRRLFSWHRQGTTIQTLVNRYPSLGWAKVLDALAFAYDNQDMIEADIIREREEIAATYRECDLASALRDKESGG